MIDNGMGRLLFPQQGFKTRDVFRVALDLDEDAGGIIPHPAVQSALCRQTVNKGTEPNPLNRATDQIAAAFMSFRRQVPHYLK